MLADVTEQGCCLRVAASDGWDAQATMNIFIRQIRQRDRQR